MPDASRARARTHGRRHSSRRGTGRPCDELLEEWEREAPAFEQILPVIKPPRPLYDVVVHEQDMRGAVGLPGGRDSEGVTLLYGVALGRLTEAFDEAGLPALSSRRRRARMSRAPER